VRARVRGPEVLGPDPVAEAATGVAGFVEDLFGVDLPVSVQAYDGSRAGPVDAPARVVIRSKDALRRLVASPNELGISRAYVAGEVDVEGDIYAALQLARRVEVESLGLAQWLALLRLTGATGLFPLPAPPQEARLRGRLHHRTRDAAAISHHYDVSNGFYRLFLGPSMTYSCAVWDDVDRTLEQAQAAKHDLICRKLGLQPGMRLLDIGCGWGGMLLHAAREYGVTAVGVTISQRQAEWARDAVAEAGLGGRVEVRLQDYRDVDDGPYDAISSIGMFEHVGLEQLGVYFGRLHELLRPGGRLLNHGIATRDEQTGRPRPSFINRYVFPDGALHEVGTVVTAIHRKSFEVRHVENLREHYELTLRAWSANLEGHWDEAVAEVGLTRARIWRLYIAACALAFESGRVQIHQTLAVRPERRPLDARSGMPLRPDWGS
jgi:cyclopropane-fatty-acyl-phospholipid synthase